MSLCKIPNIGLGQLRTKLARAAKKVVKSTRYGSAGPNTADSIPIPNTEGLKEKKAEPLPQPPSSSTVSEPSSFGTSSVFTTTFRIPRPTLIIVPRPIETAIQLGSLEAEPAVPEACSQMRMTLLAQPWFSRRRSSLMRISASSMQMNGEVRTSRPPASRRHEHIPPNF